MPSGNRSGPFGIGPMTGRAAGYCSGSDTPGSATFGHRGRGRGQASGRGFARFLPAGILSEEATTDQPAEMKARASRLEAILDSLRRRITAMEADNADDQQEVKP